METGEEAQLTHLDENLPPPMLSGSRSPHTVVKHMLDVICPLNLGQNLARGCELIIRHANFRFASTGMVGENGLIWYHDCQSSDPIGHDPGLCDLEILHKFTKVFREYPGRIDSLPAKSIFLVACISITINRQHAD